MSDNTPRLQLPVLAAGQAQMSVTHNEALVQLDAFTDLYLKGQFTDTPPSSPVDGDAWLLGGAPTGVWSGYAYKIAYCIDGAWRFYTPFDGLRAFVETSNGFIVYQGGTWADWNSLLSAAETSIASAATCDLGAAGSLFVAITGTTTITSFGTAADKLRFVRFAQALTLTHNATALILKSGATRITAAGDTGLYASDGSGNWREIVYQRAGAAATAADICAAGPAGTALNPAGLGIGMTPVNVLDITQSQNAVSLVKLLNASSGAATQAGFEVGNGASVGGLFHTGTNYTASGFFQQDMTYFYSLGAGGIGIATGSAHPIYFGINNNEAARFGSDGSFLLGTATNGGWTGVAQLEAKNGNVPISAYCTGTASSDHAIVARVDSTGASFAALSYDGTTVGSIGTNGTNAVYGTTSDARLKTVLADQGDYRGAIQALWVGDFAWKADGRRSFGVLAQQAHAVMPYHLGVSEPANDEGLWQASSEPFAHLALWGVKDIYALVARLDARIAELEGRGAVNGPDAGAVLARAMPFVMAREGFRAAPYLCAAHVASIGYGMTHYPDGHAVSLRDAPVGPAEGETLLRQMLNGLLPRLGACLARTPSVNQAAAMLSLAYNIGAAAFAGSTLAKRFNAGDAAGAATQFLVWNKARVKGALVALPGLTARRIAERALFLTPEPKDMA